MNNLRTPMPVLRRPKRLNLKDLSQVLWWWWRVSHARSPKSTLPSQESMDRPRSSLRVKTFWLASSTNVLSILAIWSMPQSPRETSTFCSISMTANLNCWTLREKSSQMFLSQMTSIWRISLTSSRLFSRKERRSAKLLFSIVWVKNKSLMSEKVMMSEEEKIAR